MDFASANFGEVRADFAHDGAVRGVFLDLEGEEVGREVVSVWKFPCHARLHMGVVGFGLEGDFGADGSVLSDFDDAGEDALFDHHGVAVFESEYSAKFFVSGVFIVGPDDVVGAGFVFAGGRAIGDEDVAVREDVAVA